MRLHAGALLRRRARHDPQVLQDAAGSSDIRRYGATFFNYTGKPLAYILSTPRRPDDHVQPAAHLLRQRGLAPRRRRVRSALRLSRHRRLRLQRRRCRCHPPARRSAGLHRLPGTGHHRRRRARHASGRRRASTPAAACSMPTTRIGEIVNTQGLGWFEGYYKNPEAMQQRTRDGWYWTGDLGYKDERGYLYFAGRDIEWLRVDGENFVGRPIEEILQRHPDVILAAVYGVPDPDGGDRVMAALMLRDGAAFDPAGFAAFLRAQPDLSPKWLPTLRAYQPRAAADGDVEDPEERAAPAEVPCRSVPRSGVSGASAPTSRFNAFGADGLRAAARTFRRRRPVWRCWTSEGCARHLFDGPSARSQRLRHVLGRYRLPSPHARALGSARLTTRPLPQALGTHLCPSEIAQLAGHVLHHGRAAGRRGRRRSHRHTTTVSFCVLVSPTVPVTPLVLTDAAQSAAGTFAARRQRPAAIRPSARPPPMKSMPSSRCRKSRLVEAARRGSAARRAASS